MTSNHGVEQVIERLHALADEAAATLAPIARPMWWLDPADEATFTIHDQFALGQDMIVAPVVERGAVTRNVYLTAGLWRDAFDQVRAPACTCRLNLCSLKDALSMQTGKLWCSIPFHIVCSRQNIVVDRALAV